MKTKIENIWESLEANQSQEGLLFRRYSAQIHADIYIAFKAHQKQRCIAFKVANTVTTSLFEKPFLKEIRVEIHHVQDQKNNKFILFALSETQHTDIFAVFCQDLIQAVALIEDQNQLVKTLFQRFKKWQALFEKLSQTALTKSQQQGLFGELYFLKLCLENAQNQSYILDSWQGSEGLPQDFSYQNHWAVEVKTTQNKLNSIHISNEHQLDQRNFEHLFLTHLSVEMGFGKSLNTLIEEIKTMLFQNENTYYAFCQKLLSVGFYDWHKELYASTLYEVVQVDFYAITEHFPKISAYDLTAGISSVKYQLDLLVCQNFKIPFQELKQSLQSYE